MAAYPPPTENLPIFDDSVFTTASNTPLTINTAAKYFLKYPNAQGDENLQSISVNGLATFNGDINANYNIVAKTPAYATTTTISQGQSYLNFAGTGANSDGGVIRIQNNTSGAAVSLGATTTNGLNINRGILIGNNNTSNGLTVALTSDQTTPNQLNIAGNAIATGNLGGTNIDITGLLSFDYPGGYSYTMGYNTLGALLSKGLKIGNNTNTNSVQLASDTTTNNQLNITGGVSISNTQSYPQTSSQLLATLSYVNSAISGIANLLTSNNVWTGTNAFNTSTPTTTITQTYPQNTNTTQFSTIGYVNQSIASLPNTGAPVGTIQMFAGNTTEPTNYLFCSGQSLSTTGTYASLFAIIGYTYGGSGGNFTLPNFHNGTYGVMPIGSQITGGGQLGVSSQLGVTGSLQTPQIYNGNSSYLTANQLAGHTHNISPPQSSYGYNTNVSGNTTTGGTSSRVTGLQTATFPTATDNMTNFTSQQGQAQFYPSFCSVMFIIKYI